MPPNARKPSCIRPSRRRFALGLELIDDEGLLEEVAGLAGMAGGPDRHHRRSVHERAGGSAADIDAQRIRNILAAHAILRGSPLPARTSG